MLSETDKILFVLRNPVSLYKKDIIEAEPRDGNGDYVLYRQF